MKKIALAIVPFMAIGGCIYWTYIKAHVREVTAATYAEFVAQTGLTTLPESASNIRFVWSSVSLGGRAHVGKFECRLRIARNTSLADFRLYDFDEVSPEDLPFVPLDDAPSRPDLSSYGINNMDWFDVENIDEAITLERDHSHRPFIWIDTRRNILYTFWTD